MEEKEIELLQEIHKLHKLLQAEPNGYVLNPSKTLPPSAYSYVKNAETLLDKVRELINCKSVFFDQLDVQNLEEVCKNEEVADVRISADKGEKILKPLMEKATKQIELELMTLFETITELIEAGLLKDE